jgi:hypothetical protein
MPFELRSAAGLALLSLLVPLITLYILKIRRQKLTVPSTWLWAAAERDLLAKSPFKRLIVQVPLVLQALAIILLALSLAKPATRGGAVPGDHLALVIDTSASMGARGPDGRTRIAEARDVAKRLVSELRPGADAMIIDAGREPRIASPLDRDVRRLSAAIERVDAREVEGQLGRAVALASDRLRQIPGDDRGLRRIVVISDGVLADREALSSSELPLEVIRVGSPIDNLAIVRIDVRSGTDSATKRAQVQVFALLVNYAGTKRDLFVTLRLKNATEPLASRRLELGPGERAPVVLSFEPERGDQGSGLIVELSPGDALAADDRAYGRVPPGRRLPVVMTPEGGSVWVQRALRADPDVELFTTPLEKLASADVPGDALVIVDGACPTVVPGADFVILNPPPGRCLSATLGERIEQPHLTSWTESDPRLRFLTLDGVELISARRIETEGPADVLVRAQQGVLMSDVSSPGRTGTLLSFDVGDSTWPLKASFVLFVRNLVELARAHRAHGVTGPARTGEPLRVRVPVDAQEVNVESPEGQPAKLVARSGLAVIPEATRAGFYHVSWQGARPGSVLVASNLTSEAESDVRPRELGTARQPVKVAAASELSDPFTEWSWLFALIALAFIVFDVLWLTRRTRPQPALDRGRPRLPERPRPSTEPAREAG